MSRLHGQRYRAAAGGPFKPMLAAVAEAPLRDPALVYEPKYDGIRAIVEAGGTGSSAGPVRIWSRNGNEKTTQFPEIVEALERWAVRRKDRCVFDGEIVALDARGRPLGFQALQGRIHVVRHGHVVPPRADRDGASVPVAFVAFDLLKEGAADLRGRLLTERRARLEQVLAGTAGKTGVIRLSDFVKGDGRKLYARAVERGWEGVIAKRADSMYQSGRRTPDWRKIKITREQEFVVGGWTEPRGLRSGFGSLILGVQDPGEGLRYVGHVGTGFDGREIDRLMAIFRRLERRDCPFVDTPPTNERPHWLEPELVAQVRFTEWTDEGMLRHPVYLGLRDDKSASDVVREEQAPAAPAHAAAGRTRRPASAGQRPSGADRRAHVSPTVRSRQGARKSKVAGSPSSVEQGAILEQLDTLEEAWRDGYLTLPGGEELLVTNLHKVFWPEGGRTKGDLFRYYVKVAPYLLPVLDDRPLVMKRFPNGIAAKPFYQHRVPQAPAGVRLEIVEDDERRPQIIGGNLITLMYTTQLAAISQDPWFSRQASLEFPDHAALDLDPMPGVPFKQVLDVARWLRDELDALGAVGFPKTSGSDGLHIYIPLPPDTPYEAGMIFCQIVASLVAARHPKHATTERMVRSRSAGSVYIDCLQNIMGKTLASAYSARASEWAGVSTPLTWQEIDQGVRKEDFTIDTVPARLKELGDIWKALRTAKGVDLERAAARAEKRMQPTAGTGG